MSSLPLENLYKECFLAIRFSRNNLLNCLNRSEELTKRLAIHSDLLSHAISTGVVETIKILLDHNFDINVVTNGINTLGHAVHLWPGQSIVEFLISRGAKLYSLNSVSPCNKHTI